MFGSPLPIAILERKWIDSSLQMVERGLVDITGIEFDLSQTINPTFKNIRDVGSFFCLFQTETLREPITIAVNSPAAFDVARNESQFVKYTWEQPMQIDFQPTNAAPPTLPFSLNSFSTMQRELVPHSHVSFPWPVKLEFDESCQLGITSSQANRQWSLMVWRMTPDGLLADQRENLNLISYTYPNSSSASSSRTLISANTDWENWYRVINISEANLVTVFAELGASAVAWRPQFAHICRWKLRRSSLQNPPLGGTIRTQVLKNGTAIDTANLTIPTDNSVATYQYSIAANAFNYSDTITIRTDQCGPGEHFELCVTVEPVL